MEVETRFVGEKARHNRLMIAGGLFIANVLLQVTF
jgi:hypothetical protein